MLWISYLLAYSGKPARRQAGSSVYYAVVSAYAAEDIARNDRQLLWRTTMTVNTQGVSMRESLPPLIVTGGEFFGRPTEGPIAIRRQVRRGTVKLGPLVVISSDVPTTSPAETAPADKPSETDPKNPPPK